MDCTFVYYVYEDCSMSVHVKGLYIHVHVHCMRVWIVV